MSTLNKVKPYLQRATELDSFEPVVAYYCRLHALMTLAKAQQNGETSDEHKAVIADCLKRSEDRKQVVDLSNGQEVMESFALKVFESADESDRSGRTDKTTASNFWASATLIEICAQFYGGELPPDFSEKVRYAKYRAVTIRDCIRQGIDPSPVQDELAGYMDETAPDVGATAPPPAATPAPAAAPTSAAALEAQQLRDQIARAEEAQKLREQIARAEAAASAPPPALPPATSPATDEAQRLREQIAAAEAAAAAQAVAAAPAAAPAPPPSADAQRLREQIAAAEAAAAARSAAPAAAARVPAVAATMPSTVLSGAPIPPGKPRTNLSDEVKAAAKKKADFAASALDFDDAASARKLLREALAMLEEPS